jgi:L-galactose dehydrogenase/L-glyceraldehyde 3-phosphate reductase
MIHRTLGRTGLAVPVVSFGAGPVSGLMTSDDTAAQRATVDRAIQAGIDWFDTAAGYGNGRSEENLGRVLAELGAADRVRIATKVRIPAEAFGRIGEYVRESMAASLRRLRVPRVALLQLHNGITAQRDDEPASITPADILGPGGVLEAVRQLQRGGLVSHLGLTGTGHPEAMKEVIRTGGFDTLQVPYNLLNPSAGKAEAPADGETDYGNVIADCAAAGMGVFAIRVFAGGALLGQPPSAHTLKTPYFPLALYERDRSRADRLRGLLSDGIAPTELAVRFALAHPAITSAIIGFGSPAHVDELARLPVGELLPSALASLLFR